MKKMLALSAVLFFVQHLQAQLPEDAIRMSWNAPSGTARHQAIGGAMGSLGGEITSVFVNPAGIGFYKTAELVLSPGLSLLNGSGNFRGTDATATSASRFNLGTSGILWSSGGGGRSRWSNKTASIAVNRTANFNGRTLYRGENDYSSFSESFAEEFAYSGVPIDEFMYRAPLSLGTKLAHYTYLLDTLTVGGVTEVAALPMISPIINGTDFTVSQEKNIITKGGITEIAFAYAANMDDKLYIGGSIGVPIVNYERISTITERDITGDNDNYFNYAQYREEYSSKGVGINARLGMIVRPAPQFRAGLAIHTPTLYGLRERTLGRMEVDSEGFVSGVRVATADSIYTQFGAAIPQYRYDMISPWKFLVSGSYVISEVEDVTRQKGFITADIEYVTHRSSRFYSAEPGDDGAYYRSVNEGVKLSYKGALNFRVGGELKFNTLMARVGFAYYGNPYDDEELKARLMNVSGGLGYRNKGVFVDLTYVQGLNRDVNFPYRLSDKANTFADVRNHNANVLLTVGFKL